MATEQQRSKALELLEKHGRDTVCYQSLEPGLDYWFDGAEGCVAYADIGSAWVACGGPICPEDSRDQVVERFCDAARSAGKRPRFFANEVPAASLANTLIGEQPEWNPENWPEVLRSKSSLREQLRRARAKGVTARAVTAEEIGDRDGELHRRVCRMARDWQKNQAMAPMSFVVKLDLFGNAELKRYLVAEKEGEVVALLALLPIPARRGWFVEDLIRAHDAPNGTSELLFDAAMRAAQEAEIELVSFGLAPLSGAVSPWLRRIKGSSSWLYDFDGLRRFKAKLQPNAQRKVYLSYPKEERGLRATIDSLSAFADGSWISFGFKTLLHALPTLAWVLALMLIPWTALLAAAPTESWFPSAGIKAGWIVYDGLLFGLLIDLSLRWRPWMARLLSVLAALDAGLGGWQLAAYSGSRIDGPLEWLLAVMAVAAPTIAALCLGIGADMRHKLYLPMPARVSSDGE